MKGVALMEGETVYKNGQHTAIHPPLLIIWGVLFIFTFLVGLLVQLLLLPHVFPAWHAGDGLLIGLDCVAFHKIAVGLAERIHTEGWSAWTLRPGGQPVAGVAAVFYALITPKPWVVLPLSAALHATAGLVLMFIVNKICGNWRKSLLATLPFVFFPSTLTWTSQMHNDSYAILGGLLFIYGWIILAQDSQLWSWRPTIYATAMIILGAVLAWLVRPYVVQMLQAIGILVALLLAVRFMLPAIHGSTSWPRVIFIIALISILLGVVSPLTQTSLARDITPQDITPSEPSEAGEPPNEAFKWKDIPWLPNSIENKLYSVGRLRWSVIRSWTHAASNIDTEVKLESLSQMISYLPRAVEIAFLAPFPKMWFGQGSKPPNTMMRRVSTFEMVIVYIALLGLPYALWRWRKDIRLWVIMLFCCGMLVIYAFTIPNVGTLYRMRYPYLMTCVALGIAGWGKFWDYLKNPSRQSFLRKLRFLSS